MPVEAGLYAAWLAWLLAGLGDFLLHRRTALPLTSGIGESALHLVQLAVLGSATVAWLALAPGWPLLCVIATAVVLHAVAGYADTVVAVGRRRLLPAEQHLHSVLDLAPWIALFLVFHLQGAAAAAAGWTVAARGAPPALWAALLIPAAVLCVLPAAIEFREAWQARTMAVRAHG